MLNPKVQKKNAGLAAAAQRKETTQAHTLRRTPAHDNATQSTKSLIQPKVKLGKPNDRFEQEADRVADRVVSDSPTTSPQTPSAQATSTPSTPTAAQAKPASVSFSSSATAQRKGFAPVIGSTQSGSQRMLQSRQFAGITDTINRKETAKNDDTSNAELTIGTLKGGIQTKADLTSDEPSMPASFEVDLNAAKSGGSPLPGGVQQSLGQRFDADFSTVRIHTDSTAAKMNQQIAARAFAHGNHIFFNKGEYKPGSKEGLRLLAHELTHTIQQGAVTRPYKGGAPTNAPENPQAAVAESASDIASRQLGNAQSAEAPGLMAMPSLGVPVHPMALPARDPHVDLQRKFTPVMPGISQTNTQVQGGWLGEKLNRYANNIPGWTLITVVVGYNPLLERSVPRTAQNFLKGIIGLVPGGNALYEKLEEYGLISESFKWLGDQLSSLDLSWRRVARELEEAWDEMSIRYSFSRNIGIVKRHLMSIYEDVKTFGKRVVTKVSSLLRSALVIPLATYIKNQTRAYPLMTVLLGEDPLTGESVDRNLLTIATGFLMLTEDGEAYLQKLNESGKLQELSDWFDAEIVKLDINAETVTKLFSQAWDLLTVENLIHPLKTFKAIYDLFSAPIIRIANFVGAVASKVFSAIKDWLIGLLKAHAHKIPGYPLLSVILGKDPVTQEVVPRTATNFIRGFMSFVPGGLEKFENLQKSGAIDKAFAWLEAEVVKLDLSWEAIKGLFSQVWNSFSINDFLDPIGAFERVVGIFAAPVQRIINFASAVGMKVLEFIFSGVMGPLGEKVLAIFKRASTTFVKIIKDPIGFLANLLEAMGQGFRNFSSNIATHLLNGLAGWLFGALEGSGLKLPERWDMKGILSVVTQVMGLTYEKVRKKLVKQLGEKAVKRAESGFEFIKLMVTEGVAGVWQKLVEYLSGLKDKVLGAIQDWVTSKIVTIAIEKLATMWNPVGAIIQGIITIYNAVSFFIERIKQIMALVDSVVNSIANIADKKLGDAAIAIETAMARTIPVIIGFLASLIGLGGISGEIKKILGKLQEFIDKGIDKLVGWIVKQVKKLIAGGKAAWAKGKDGLAALFQWWTKKKPVQTADGASHTIFFKGEGKNAKLTIATTPMDYQKFIGDLIAQEKLNKDDAKVKSALKIAKAIEKEKSKTVTEDKKEQQAKDIAALVDQLVDATKELPLVGESGTNSDPVYGPLRNGWGTFTRLKYQKSPHFMGSHPTVGNDSNFEAINIRRKGSGSLYVKGHLLNDNLGGPGDTWQNLTPITGAANDDHKRNFEKIAKIAVNGTEARLSKSPSTASGAIEDFNCIATFGRSLATAHGQLADQESEAYPAGWDEDWNASIVMRILQAEVYVPLTIECSVKYKNKLADAYTTHNYSVKNDINYGDLTKYQLVARPKTTFVIVDKINWEADRWQDAMAEVMKLNLIGAGRAKAIYDELKDKGQIRNFKAVSGITLRKLTEKNSDYKFKIGKKTPTPAPSNAGEAGGNTN
ncbi:Uncharacterised protein [BD1-7 clade bacterium]|uniref:eCIS core domain-containing protein n=1 Tax=BD1-7 clade bacterium TaxID=2029982 RepID=A0A5S9QPY6_9GAMM|nr:Uncharacterised protein [BD1-7 clade bacterium]